MILFALLFVSSNVLYLSNFIISFWVNPSAPLEQRDNIISIPIGDTNKFFSLFFVFNCLINLNSKDDSSIFYFNFIILSN